MHSRATTTISILRGQEIDEWGDPMDNSQVAASGILASIAKMKEYVKNEVSTQPRNIDWYRLRILRGTDVRINDRILDEKTGLIYTIVSITDLYNPVVGQDLRIDLQLVR